MGLWEVVKRRQETRLKRGEKLLEILDQGFTCAPKLSAVFQGRSPAFLSTLLFFPVYKKAPMSISSLAAYYDS